MNLFTEEKQTHRHRKQAYDYQRRRGGGINGAWDWQIHITIYKIDKQQGFTV